MMEFSANETAALEAIGGEYELGGFLSCQMSANMETEERRFEDVPFDMVCHVNSEWHTYGYGYGLNWNWVISDWRMDKYGRGSYTDRHNVSIS